MRGIHFEIPNKYGRQLYDLLGKLPIENWHWRIGGEESYIIEEGTLGRDLFPTVCVLDSHAFLKIISEEDYYLIFTDLKAFPSYASVKEVATYQEFLECDCQFVLLLVDSCYVTIYAKQDDVIRQLHKQAHEKNYKNIEYITDDNDARTRLITF
ncbi:DUF2691 family protein [Lysinibacillus sp. NPDC048646]|uniref:DUF2691 family protein n=1 Tax=Lysinibacillus sp. NPDC048646 TaxID=3390574 RepID=UPI003D09049A